MTGSDAENLQALLKDDIHSETSKIAWSELQRFFAAGKAIYVSLDLDLVEVALHVANDNSGKIRQWMDKGKLSHVTNEQAKRWIDNDAIVWAVVVKPWILVQDLKENHDEH